MSQQRLPDHTFGRKYVVVFPDAMAVLSADPQGFPALRVLIWMWGSLSFEVWRSIRQVEVAEQLGTSRASVNAGLKKLLELGFIERQGAGPRQEWRLTPEGGWRGTAGRYQKTMRERRGPFRVVPGGKAEGDNAEGTEG